MSDLAILVPSRGRPQQMAELLAAVGRTAVTAPLVYVGLDDDDADYGDLTAHYSNVVVHRGPRQLLAAKTNQLADEALAAPNRPRFLASLGDDHRPRTPGWDRKLMGAIGQLGKPGWAYGDDKLQGPNLPTAWVQSADLVDALGWVMLPACQHMYVDNVVLELGRETGRIVYCPGVVVEHMHPVAGKAQWDSSYKESNSARQYSRDLAAFEEWKAAGLADDAKKVLAT